MEHASVRLAGLILAGAGEYCASSNQLYGCELCPGDKSDMPSGSNWVTTTTKTLLKHYFPNFAECVCNNLIVNYARVQKLKVLRYVSR